MSVRLVGILAIALLVAFGGGWIIGQSGRATAEDGRRRLEFTANVSDVRASTLDGRVSLFLVNFGDASRHFEQARGTAERLQASLREVGQAERAGRVEIVVAHLRDAQRLAASLDAGSHKAAEEALRALATVSLD